VSWAALALVGAAAVVAARWYASRVDELGRRRDFPLVSVVLLAVLAAGAATPGVLRARQERRLAGVASALAGRPVAVRCQALGGAFVDAGPELGYVLYWRTVYPARPDGYRSSSCRPGGAMDEHLPDAPWAPAGA